MKRVDRYLSLFLKGLTAELSHFVTSGKEILLIATPLSPFDEDMH